MEIDCVIVWTTIGSSTDGHKLASVLVEERLAACVNVMSEMESVYRWQGKVETERERQVVMKTTANRIPALKARLRELHDYELPEFIVLPITAGSEPYLQWIRESAAG
jgi:periplasmic divalent cation tolerance protein